MPEIVLRRSLTFQHNGRHFRRGEPQVVPDGDYLFLLTQGFEDPNHELQMAHPSRLARAPAGTEVPVIRTGGLGDVLMVLPGLRALAQRYPALRFTYATSHEFVPLMRDATFLHRTVPLSDLHGRFQWCIDLRGYSERDGRERYDRLAVFAKYLLNGVAPDAWAYPMVPHPDEVLRGSSITGALEHGRPVVGIAVGSHSQSGMRNWPLRHVEHLAELAFDHGMRAVLLDDVAHQLTPRLAAAGVRSLAGHLTVPALIAVVSSLDFLVTPDTGVVHLAEALRVRTVGYFTTVVPEARAVHYTHVRTLYAGVPCAPCYHAPTCGLPPGETKCAVAVTPTRVWEEIEWMAQHSPPYHYRAALAAPADAPAWQPVQFGALAEAN